MKATRIKYTPAANEFIRKIHPSLKKPLREIIEELLVDPLKGKPLQEAYTGFRSHRFKRYRVIYRYDEEDNNVEVVFAGPRRDVYRLFAEYLKKARGKGIRTPLATSRKTTR